MSATGASGGPAGPIWCVSLSVPAAALTIFEAALESLGGALDSAAPEPGGRPVALRLYLAAPPHPENLVALLAGAAEAAGVEPPEPAVDCLEPRDWVAESQAALPPIRTGRFWVHGSHVTPPPPPGRWPLRIEAAAAFGTGRHESTLGCLLALEDLARERSKPGRRFRTVLDMGCGSGILALAAARLWPAARVLGVDNDPGAVAVARGNARVNRLAGRVRFACGDGYRAGVFRSWLPNRGRPSRRPALPSPLVGEDTGGGRPGRRHGYERLFGRLPPTPPSSILPHKGGGGPLGLHRRHPRPKCGGLVLPGSDRFDLVVANILARPLAAMAPGLRRVLVPGGTAVLAGLLASQEHQVEAPHEALGIRLVRRFRLGEWVILVVRG